MTGATTSPPPDDLWEIVRTLVAERKKREIDPTLTKLRELELREPEGESDRHAHARIAELGGLIELLAGWYEDMNRLETARLVQLLSLGARVQKMIEGAGGIVPLRRGARRPEDSAGAGES
ncbi:MAG: hypothetical protein WD270_02140 [Acetobacterales bacterium]